MLHIGNVQISWREILDVGLVAILYYRLILLIKGTRAVPVMYGLILVALLYYASDLVGLPTLHWILANFLGSIFIVVIVLFQADIRKALAEVGAGGIFLRQKNVREDVLEELVRALTTMAQSRTGALVVIEKSVPLGEYIDRGVKLGASISKELLMTIFFPDTPLHDGAVILRGEQLAAASCILPLATGAKLKSQYGTRHRAALGISEETDAIAVVVSEERGTISVAIGGRLTASLDEIRLRRVIRNAWAK